MKRNVLEPSRRGDNLRKAVPAQNGARRQRPEAGFRDFGAGASPRVEELYRLNHHYQTVDFVRGKRREYLKLNHHEMDIWEAIQLLDRLIDASDPDTELS